MKLSDCRYGIKLAANGAAQFHCLQACGGYNISVVSVLQVTRVTSDGKGETVTEQDSMYSLTSLHLHDDRPPSLQHMSTTSDREGAIGYADALAIGSSVGDLWHGLGKNWG